MKIAFAIAFTCAAAPLAAGEYCPKSHAHRSQFARPIAVPPMPKRVEAVRVRKAKPMLAWHRDLLLDPQIL